MEIEVNTVGHVCSPSFACTSDIAYAYTIDCYYKNTGKYISGAWLALAFTLFNSTFCHNTKDHEERYLSALLA